MGCCLHFYGVFGIRVKSSYRPTLRENCGFSFLPPIGQERTGLTSVAPNVGQSWSQNSVDSKRFVSKVHALRRNTDQQLVAPSKFMQFASTGRTRRKPGRLGQVVHLASSCESHSETFLSQPEWTSPLVGVAIPDWRGSGMTLFASERRSYCSREGSVTCARFA